MAAHPSVDPSRAVRHALVIGGGVAGLLAARVLADHAERVTIVERDELPAGPTPRKGAPQARHVHVLLARGREALEGLFPGLEAELAAAGAIPIDWTADTAWLSAAGWARRFPSHLRSHACSRDLLEWALRRRLSAEPRVAFLPRHEVAGLIATDDGARVVGIRARDRAAGADGAGAARPLWADLVVDAAGRGSRAPRWLEEIGYAAPAETVVNAFLGYTSRLYARPAGFQADWKGLYIQSDPPRTLRGGVLLPIEGDRWLVTLGGAGKDYAPSDEAGFLAFARSLPSQALYEAIREATPLSPIATYRATENRIRHYERLARWPEGFAVTGDGVCAFNPVYGQGMTNAALAALTLDDCLRAAGRRDAAQPGLTHRFQRELARRNQTPWLLATGADYRVPQTAGGAPSPTMRLSHRYLDRALRAATRDSAVRLALMEVLHLVKPPATLFRPDVLWRVLAPATTARPAIATAPGSAYPSRLGPSGVAVNSRAGTFVE
jgi:2-polyprenyl-6-methoxyphenol hydroxylase-like FAD-dependent oxidoreductase